MNARTAEAIGVATGRVTTRISMRFSADGSTAACLASDGGALQVERWTFGATADRSRLLLTPDGETLSTQLLPLPDERVLLVRHGAGRHDLVVLEPTGSGPRERLLGTVHAPGFRLLADHADDALALAVQTEFDGTSSVWRVLPDAPWLERLAAVPWSLFGGVGLDMEGRYLGCTRHGKGGPTAVALDLWTGRAEPLPVARRLANATHLLLAEPHSGLVVVAAETGAGLHLAYTSRLDDELRFPRSLTRIDGTVRPLAAAPGGGRVALQVRRGARTHLLVHHLHDDAVHEVDLPPGLIGGVAAWSATGLRFPYRSPSCPSAIATVTAPADAEPLVSRLAGLDPSPTGRPWQPATVERFPGPDGEIEAVVYGDWRTADRVVVALHGGPEAAWELEYHPLLQRLAAAGLAVVAPNQRGSTGYGPQHAEAIHHAWGGPDLADIGAVGDALRRGRPAAASAPLLYGESYGAFLALLAAGHRPDLWSRCAVVAPFLSGSLLHAEAGPEVRDLVDRLGGRSAGSGDVLAVADRIRAPLMVVHGGADPTVPVTQSRRLGDHLLRVGRTRLRYVEVPDADHDPLGASASLSARVVEFLAAS